MDALEYVLLGIILRAGGKLPEGIAAEGMTDPRLRRVIRGLAANDKTPLLGWLKGEGVVPQNGEGVVEAIARNMRRRNDRTWMRRFAGEMTDAARTMGVEEFKRFVEGRLK